MSEVVSHEAASSAGKKKPLPPPPGFPQSAPETLEWTEPRVPRRSRTAWVVAISASLLAIALGYVGSEQWKEREAALARLTKTQADLQAVSQERTRIAADLHSQQGLAAEQKQRLDQSASELTELQAKLGATEARLNELEAQSLALNEHLSEFRALTQKFQRMIDSGKLQISFRRGRMIVELPAAVLFASGSADLSAEGRQALQEIAKILRQVPGKRLMVGGHTDDVPIGRNAGAYSSNWSLSAARAVKVTESLIDAGMRADHLVAAGYGEFDPIASNASERGRQKNRRIEIVLEPVLAGLPGALANLKNDSTLAKPVAKGVR